jgi:plasmid stabilization system protein ParE
MPAYKIVRHPSVSGDLLDIAFLIADYAGIEVALRKVGEIEVAIGKLADLPHVGSLRHEIAEGIRAIPAAGKAVICFVVDDDHIEVRIMAIGYAGSDWIAETKART